MSQDIPKFIKDGKVAVLYSPGFGAGWSSWCRDEDAEKVLFDPEIVAIYISVTDEKQRDEMIKAYCEDKYPDMYIGGLRDLEVAWLPIGTHFQIHEYDGSESIDIRDEMEWTIA